MLYDHNSTKTNFLQDTTKPKEERYNWEDKLVGKHGMMEHGLEFTFTRPKVFSTSNIQARKSLICLEVHIFL